MRKTLCLRQWIRPSAETSMLTEGVGDCNGKRTGIPCMPNEDNKYCRLYYPITITTYEVEEKE